MSSSKEPIRLRQRQTSKGLTSLYLDIYLDGKRTYEYLKLYLVPERTREDKQKNKETLRLAEAIRAKRVVDLQNGEYGFKSSFKENTLFFPYYCSMVESRMGEDTKGNWGNWRSCLKHLEKYESNRKITFKDITPEWVQGFKDYLEKDAKAWSQDYRRRLDYHPLARNSRVSYFNKLKACLNKAFEERIIPVNPARGIEAIKAEEGNRMYLTLEEIQILARTECSYPAVKKAFLFSCLTGLRRSDIQKLTWAEVHQQGDFTRLIFKQKKTKGQEYLDISPQAAELMGDRGNPDDKVFEDFLTPGATNNAVQMWVMKAGIKKTITFHCARHTFAVLMLDLGTDIYTVSKLLGHKLLSTTQIYAKVLDKNKQAAVSRIPTIFPSDSDHGKGTDAK